MMCSSAIASSCSPWPSIRWMIWTHNPAVQPHKEPSINPHTSVLKTEIAVRGTSSIFVKAEKCQILKPNCFSTTSCLTVVMLSPSSYTHDYTILFSPFQIASLKDLRKKCTSFLCFSWRQRASVRFNSCCSIRLKCGKVFLIQ
jgi:hypothetical protein